MKSQNTSFEDSPIGGGEVFVIASVHICDKDMSL